MQGIIDRVPPNSLDAERAVLGGLILQNQAIDLVQEMLRPADFYSEANGRIFQAILDLRSASIPVDTVTLRDALARSNKLQVVGGDAYVLALTDTIPVMENIRAHAAIVREKALVRRLIDLGHSIAARGYGDYGNAQEFLDQIGKAVFEAATGHVESKGARVRDVMIEVFEELHLLARAGDRVSGLTTGFPQLDDMTAGMHPGDLIIVAGRPGMGKTTFALNLGVNACQARMADKKPAAVAVFSLEMPATQLVKRMLASEARVASTRLRTARVDKRDWQSLASTAQVLSDLPIFIEDASGLTLMDLRAKTRRHMTEHGLALVIIDYLQLMRSGVKNDSREQEISEISRSLKALAKELGVPVVALSQLNRSVESRNNKDKRPQLADLRESGAIEQDADTIMFVYRDEVYNCDTPEQGVAEIIIRKQRSGPTGTVKLRFINECTRFEPISSGDVERQTA